MRYGYLFLGIILLGLVFLPGPASAQTCTYDYDCDCQDNGNTCYDTYCDGMNCQVGGGTLYESCDDSDGDCHETGNSCDSYPNNNQCKYDYYDYYDYCTMSDSDRDCGARNYYCSGDYCDYTPTAETWSCGNNDYPNGEWGCWDNEPYCTGGNTCNLEQPGTVKETTCSAPTGASCSGTIYTCQSSGGHQMCLSDGPQSSSGSCSADKCDTTAAACNGGPWNRFCGTSTSNTPSYNVCSGGVNIDASGSSSACDSNTNNFCTDGQCTGTVRYSECTGSGTCDTTATTYYESDPVSAATGYTLTSSCGTTGTTYCGYSSYNGCAGVGGSNGKCQKTRIAYRCDVNDDCLSNQGTDTTNVASGKVCDGGSEVNPSATQYCDVYEQCTLLSCSGTLWYNDCTSSNTCPNDATGYSQAVYASAGYTFTTSCTDSSAYCSGPGSYYCSGSGSPNTCARQRDAYTCDGTGTCDYYEPETDYMASGYVCDAGTEVYRSLTQYCAITNQCTNGACSGSIWHNGCNTGGSCVTGTSGYQETVYADVGYTLTGSCGKTGTTICANGTWVCTGSGSPNSCERGREQYRCSSLQNCNEYVGEVFDDIATDYVCDNADGSEDPVTATKYCGITNSCNDGWCTGTRYYNGCNNAGSCRTGSNGAPVAINASTGYTLTLTCGTTGTTYCGMSSYNACVGAGSPYTCQRRADYRWCDAAHTCNYDSGNDYTANIQSGYVCNTTNANEVLGSTMYYAFSNNYADCTSSNPDSGFGDRRDTRYACDGANGQGSSVGTVDSDCGTGCCLDAGASTSCISSGTTTSNFYSFGPGDSTSNDYCLSARVWDCQSGSGSSQCSSSSFGCNYSNCISTQGKLIIQNTTGHNMTIIDKVGRVLLRGSLFQSTGTSPPAGSYQIQTGAGTPQAWVTQPAGSLYLKGTANVLQGSVTPSGNNDFIVQNNTGTNVAYIEGSNGNLYTISTVSQGAIT